MKRFIILFFCISIVLSAETLLPSSFLSTKRVLWYNDAGPYKGLGPREVLQPDWSSSEYVDDILTNAETVCNHLGVEFADFDSTFALYSRSGLSFTQSLYYYVDTTLFYLPQSVRSGTWAGDYVADSRMWESVWRDFNFANVIEIEYGDIIKFDNVPCSFEVALEQLEEWLSYDVWGKVVFTVDSAISAGEVFEFMDTAPYIRTLVIEDDDCSNELFALIWPNMIGCDCAGILKPNPVPPEPDQPSRIKHSKESSSLERSGNYLENNTDLTQPPKPQMTSYSEDDLQRAQKLEESLSVLYDPEYPDLAVYIRIENTGELFFNSERLTSVEQLSANTELQRLIEGLYQLPTLPYLNLPVERGSKILLACGDRVSWGKVVEIAGIIEGIKSHGRICVVPYSIVEGREPEIQTEAFLRLLYGE